MSDRTDTIARRRIPRLMLISLFIPPLGYVLTRKWGYLALNIVTINYLALGFVVVPVHAALLVVRARQKQEEDD